MKYTTHTKKYLLSVLFCFVFALTALAFVPAGAALSQDTFGLQPVGQSIDLAGGDIRVIIGKIVRALLGLLGVLAVVITLYGGYIYMTSEGNEEKITQAKKIIINGVIGLAIILSALAITQFILNKLSEATGTGKPGPLSQCSDLGYAFAHPEECGDNFCTQFPQFCSCADKHFVVQSITPRTDNTGMNNVAIRVVFSRRIQAFVPPDDISKHITIKYNDATSTEQYSFQILGNTKLDKNTAIEAVYIGSEKCSDGSKCLPSGDYEIIVSPDIRDEKNYPLEQKTDCGEFSAEAKFKVSTGTGAGTAYLNFDGKTNYVNIGDKPQLEMSNALTVEAWIYPTGPGSPIYGGIIVNKEGEYEIARFNDGKINFAIRSNSPNVWNWVNTGYVAPLNAWTHIAWTYNVVNGQGENMVYANGLPVFQISGGAEIIDLLLDKNDFRIGARQGATQFFQGGIDKVAVYKRALPAESILAHFKEGRLKFFGGDKKDLAGAWSFDEGKGTVARDVSGNQLDGIITGAEWRLDVLETDGKIKDTIKPELTAIRIKTIDKNGKEEEVSDGKLLRGESYFFSTDVTDNSGAGYANMLVDKISAFQEKTYGYYDGPSVKRGSDAPVGNPYKFNNRLYFPINTKPLESYLVTIRAFDIDNNSDFVTTSFKIIGEHCKNGVQDGDETGVDTGGSCGGADGDKCLTDLDCAYSFKCLDVFGDGDKMCKPFPRIEDIDPMDGAGGNWITVTGRHFGANPGEIAFGYNENWVGAEVVQCGPKAGKSWADSWVIVAVPTSTEKLPLNSESSVRLTADYSLMENGKEFKPSDSSIDDWGPKPGPKAGLFTKTGVERPGLCQVATAEKVYDEDGKLLADEGASSAPMDTKIQALGKALGREKGDSNLFFSLGKAGGGKDSPAKIKSKSDWTDSQIFSTVPNLSVGWYGVYAQVKDKNGQAQESNKVPFKILNLKDIEAPIISSIDPAEVTPGSYFTIFGKHFGDDTGEVYLSIEPAGPDCGDSCKLNVSLPLFCGDTWQDEQVIVEVPKDFPMDAFAKATPGRADLYITLKRALNGPKTAGNDQFAVISGQPTPSLCNLQPDSGPAPLPEGEKLNLFGVNFSNQPSAHFWTEKSVLDKLVTWLVAPFEQLKLMDLSEGKTRGQKIETIIPYYKDEYGDYTMQTGPIKVRSKDGKASNGMNYTVSDCRDADQKLKEDMDLKAMRCCDVDGKDTGRWKSKIFACDGETRDAGYVWRFTTGKISGLPFVVEGCDQANWNDASKPLEFPSPVPWENWEQGKEACLNATVAVRFSMPIDAKTLTTSTVKLYKCKEDAKGGHNCAKENVEMINLDDLHENGKFGGYLWYEPSGVLKIHIPPPDLTPNTWYHAELLAGDKGIMSLENVNELGKNKEKREPLLRTRPCDELGNNLNTGFCYDFKTGVGLCTLIGADISPTDYLTHLLGVLQDPSWPYDPAHIFNPPHPYYYVVWGRGNQKCSVLNVDGLGWQWDSSVHEWATSENAPTALGAIPRYTDSRAAVTALANTAPDDVKITASTTTSQTPEIGSSASQFKTITAYSALIIDLLNPQVIDYWPNCEEACINSIVGVRFNQLMMEEDYQKGIHIHKCKDEFCDDIEVGELQLDKVEPDAKEPMLVMRAYPKFPLEPNTWYKVDVTSEIKAIGAFKKNKDNNIIAKLPGRGVEPFTWRFRTKASGTPCLADKIDIIPNPFAANLIGQKNLYSAMPKGAPDQCGPDGQELNPWWFGWNWWSSDKDVAVISTFASNKSNKPFCTLGCKLQGSNVSSDQTAPYLCGNGIVDPGEDCDIANGEIPGKSCGYDCLRPGNKEKSATSTADIKKCGDGFVSTSFGEECDPGIDKQKNYCNSDCTWTGSTATPPKGDLAVSWCGSGSVTVGEDCDVKIATSTVPKEPWKSQVGCSSKCLHLGTALSQTWCINEANDPEGLEIPACKSAVSVCGNGFLENGEECEVGENGATKDICDNKCLLKNVCGTGFQQCEKGKEGCKDDCTFVGSSLGYSVPSLCGDSVIGIGEDAVCEGKSLPSASKIQSPVQIATAVGLSGISKEYNGKPSQFTNIFAKTTEYLTAGGVFKPLAGEKGGEKQGAGDYYLQCGFTEFAEPITNPAPWKYNDCNDNLENKYGVGANSCCYPRPVRQKEYPADGAGIITTKPVCRNTYIEAVFDTAIDEKSLDGNAVIVAGYSDNEKISSCDYTDNQIDATDLVKNSLAFATEQPVSSQTGFWGRIWQSIKHFFARLFGIEDAIASNVGNLLGKPISKWCMGGIVLRPEVHYDFTTTTVDNEITAVVTSTISLYIDNVLEPDRVYAVILRGGLKGLKDFRGVGIRGKDAVDEINAIYRGDDIWLFRTGKDICKIKSIAVDPDSYLFDKPFTTYNFHAIVTSVNDQMIVPTQAYEWRWNWAPKKDKVFEIPVPGTPTDTDWAELGAKNVEGFVTAMAQAIVTADLSQSDNHKGKIFTGKTGLTAMFCENPWPARQGNKWAPFKDLEFNFSMSYCADSGLSGVLVDDLPYFQKQFTYLKDASKVPDVPKICTISNKSCQSDVECVMSLYNIPNVGEVKMFPGMGLCKKEQKYGYDQGQIKFCREGSVYDCAIKGKIGKIGTLGGKEYGYFSDLATDGNKLYAAVNLKGVAVFDISNPQTPQLKQFISADGARSLTMRGDIIAVAAGNNGVYIIERRPDGILELKGKYDAIDYASAVAFNTDPAYPKEILVAGVHDGVVAIDFSDSQNLKFVGSYKTSGSARDVKMQGNFVYIADGAAGVKITTFKHLSEEEGVEFPIVGEIDTPGHAYALAVADNHIYVADYSQGLQIIDMGNSSNPAPVIVGSKFLNGNAVNIDIVGKIALLAVDTKGMYIVGVSDDDDPQIRGVYKPVDSTSNVKIDSQYAYVLAMGDGITMFDFNGVNNDAYECRAQNEYVEFKTQSDKCVDQYAQTVFAGQTLSDDTLKRYLFLTDKEDAVGVQILTNPDRLSASEWYKKKFPESQSKMQNITIPNDVITGNDGVNDGKNYYINARNVVIDKNSDYVLYNNIYQFSLNQGAQADSQDVLEQLMNSIVFNINLSDYGYCLKETPDIPFGELPKSESLRAAVNDDYSCSTDFECHNPDGTILDGTNGVCSLARTKFFRDLGRLQDIRAIQQKLDSHFANAYGINFKGDLKGGTYIPGYTVSMWPSWNQTLGAIPNVGNLPLEKINAWTSCSDPKADKQTCWNAASSTYSCPAFSQVYEYEFVSSTHSYLLHGPLEFLNKKNNLVKDTIEADKFIDTPRCQSELWSPYGQKCGDGIIQPNNGEQCDPPGSAQLGPVGDMPIKAGKCEFRPEIACTESKADCGYYGPLNAPIDIESKVKFFSPTLGYCVKRQSNERLAIASEADKLRNKYQLFGCRQDADCREPGLYQGSFDIGLHSDDAVFALKQDFSNKNFIASLQFNGSDFLCAHTDKAVLQVQNCQGAEAGKQDVNCADYLSGGKASWLCDSSCKWQKGICKATIQCGNGIVEGKENCDDGAKLNGTYGHCNTNCSGLYEKFCGNNKLDTDAAGHPLELCEKVDQQQIVFRTNGNPPKGVRLVCNDYLRDIDVSDLLEKMCGADLICKGIYGMIFSPIAAISNGCIEFNKHCQGDYKLLCDTNDDCNNVTAQNAFFDLNQNTLANFSENLYAPATFYYGPCVTPQYGPVYSYNKHKELSCAWDCQNYGSYCGDNFLNKDYGEECDDGNDNNADACRNNCTLNTASICGNGKLEEKEECDDGNTAKGDGCSPACKTEPPGFNICGDTVVDKDQGEVCDTGKENLGKVCSPEYGKSCTYCSSDCKKVLTVDATAYCGNGKIDIIKWENSFPVLETCDIIDNQVTTGTFKFIMPDPGVKIGKAVCSDKGEYRCEDNCTNLINNCIDCGKKSKYQGGTEAQLRVVNPAGGWGIYGAPAVSLYRMWSEKNYADLISEQKANSNPPDEIHNIFSEIESSPFCSPTYAVYFNSAKIKEAMNVNDLITFKMDAYQPYGAFFPYKVNGEYPVIKRDLIVSPPLPDGAFRIVLRWTAEEADFGKVEGWSNTGGNFGINVHNHFHDTMTVMSPDYWIKQKCENENFKQYCSGKDIEGIYIHPQYKVGDVYTQTVTIDTKKKNIGNYSIYISQYGNKLNPDSNLWGIAPIYDFRQSNLKIEIYGYHPGQSQYSFYEPLQVFSINNVNSSQANKDAKYWHVFNLVKQKDGQYNIQTLKETTAGNKVIDWPNGKIVTDFLGLLEAED